MTTDISVHTEEGADIKLSVYADNIDVSHEAYKEFNRYLFGVVNEISENLTQLIMAEKIQSQYNDEESALL